MTHPGSTLENGKLKIEKTKLDGVLLIHPPTQFSDFRGARAIVGASFQGCVRAGAYS